MIKVVNNNNGGVDTETTRDVLDRLDKTIRVLEAELAKPNPFGTRAALQGQLREAKALKASLNTALTSGAITLNQPLFNNRGMPTAKPGSFLEAVLKRAESAFGLFTNKFQPKGDPLKIERGDEGSPFFKKQPSLMFNQGFGPKAEPGFGPKRAEPGFTPNARAPKPPPVYLTNLAKNPKNNGISGRPGSDYPGLPNYVFGLDQVTPVQKVPGRPVPGSWPNSLGRYLVYDDNLQTTTTDIGTKVPGTVKTYYSKNPIDTGGQMVYPDGTYKASLAIPPSPDAITSKQAAGEQLYIPKAGDPWLGAPNTHVHTANKDGSPTKFQVASPIPWIGTGTSHVFQTDGTPLQKSAGVTVPGQSSQVYSEGLSVMNVKPGVFVPGSGVVSGDVRAKVYTSTNPSQQLTWSVGGDAPFDAKGQADTNPATRFDTQGQVQTYSAGQNFPGGVNQVFDTDFSAFTKRAGAEVPGSSGYDRTNKETGDADGLGPAAQVYNASLQPIKKQRGTSVPGAGAGTFYDTSGGGATTTTVAIGSPVLDPAGGVSKTQIYSAQYQPLTVQRGLLSPTGNNKTTYQTVFATSATNSGVNMSTLSRDAKGTIVHDVAALPLADGALATVQFDFSKNQYTPFVFDPGLNPEGGTIDQVIDNPKGVPTVMFVPGDKATLAKQTQKGPLNIPMNQIYVSTMAPNPNAAHQASLYTGKKGPDVIQFSKGIEAGLVDKSFAESTVLTVSAFNPKTDTATIAPGLKGTSRSLMFNQGFGASTSTTSSSRSSGGFRNFLQDPRAGGRY